MLPPSSPQNPHAQHNLQPPSSRAPLPPPSFSSGRELPALSTVPRPGSSMSISSMLGSDPGGPPRDPLLYKGGSSSTNKFASPMLQSVSASSPTKLGQRNSSLFQRSHSPEKYKVSQNQTTRPFRAYSGGSPRRPASSANIVSHDINRFGSSRNALPQYSPPSDAASRHDGKNVHSRHQSTGKMTQRPNSQPSGYSTPPLSTNEKIPPPTNAMELEGLDRSQIGKKYFGNIENNDGQAPFGQLGRDRVVSEVIEDREVSAPEGRTAQPTTYISPKQDRPNGSSYPFLSRTAVSPEPTNNQHHPKAESILNRVLERNPQYNPPPSQSPFSTESLRRLREERLVAVGLQQQGVIQSPSHPQPRFVEDTEARQEQIYPRVTSSFPGGLATAEMADQQNKIGEERNLTPKSSLSLFMDNNKRGGRVSPLPQAVQGAQGKIGGPASDPGIKNEFARMFFGIGSGVGSTGPLRSGTSTPFPPSPPRNQEPERRTPFGGRSDLVEVVKPRAGSRGGRRGRKAKEDEPKADTENGESRTPAGTTSTRGIKRSRHSHHHQ